MTINFSDCQLVRPTLALHEAFEAFVDDFLLYDGPNSNEYIPSMDNFPEYIRALHRQSQPSRHSSEATLCHHFWLYNSINQCIYGVIRIRHPLEGRFLLTEGGNIGYHIAPSYRNRGLGKLMLKLALPKAHELGIERVLVTAKEDNLASRAIIQACGGQLENVVYGPILGYRIARYFIHLSGEQQ
ncbi:GNAT family N-acetyltransferase [Celerinatantimonas diazotrophica]|uniref:Putative acetyltransferase n=1 Tax=Celerinatantimonas diazotrophica TaxID=412034 RepID=A0A4V6NEG7_9GAMM|nr:GNAT family N-acetyltransferase [Celerinatantimonas diazotrophica]TCK61491.1 putative acetyltransferase [Celerinatantimonas diazotrophica]CAG9296954.1 hypothetical protein CEDIAZO_02116 [Celerinatantimonas diazotrophica]